jgi:hypothetical protein
MARICMATSDQVHRSYQCLGTAMLNLRGPVMSTGLGPGHGYKQWLEAASEHACFASKGGAEGAGEPRLLRKAGESYFPGEGTGIATWSNDRLAHPLRRSQIVDPRRVIAIAGHRLA